MEKLLDTIFVNYTSFCLRPFELFKNASFRVDEISNQSYLNLATLAVLVLIQVLNMTEGSVNRDAVLNSASKDDATVSSRA